MGAGGDLHERASGALTRVGELVGRRHAHDVLASLPGLGRGDLADVDRLGIRTGCRISAPGPVAVAREVVISDFAVTLVLVYCGFVGGEPLLGGDDRLGIGVVGVALGEQGPGFLGGGAGGGGVGEPEGAGAVELLQLGHTLVERCGEGRGLVASWCSRARSAWSVATSADARRRAAVWWWWVAAWRVPASSWPT